jgi:hypothetical protein
LTLLISSRTRQFLPRRGGGVRRPVLKAGATALFLSLLLAGAMFWPITSQKGWVNHTGPVIRHFCPESGRLGPAHYSSRTRPELAMETCLDRNGARIYDKAVHNRIFGTVVAFWTIVLLGAFFPILRLLFVHGREVRR